VFLANSGRAVLTYRWPAQLDAFGVTTESASFLCVRPHLSYHFIMSAQRRPGHERPGHRADRPALNGGYFIFKSESRSSCAR